MKRIGIKGGMGVTGFFVPLYFILLPLYFFSAPSAQAAIKPPPSNLGLVGYWSFDDCRGATSTDFSGNGNAGALTNFALSGSTSNWVTGNAAKRGCALNFDGVNDYVDAGTSSSLSPTAITTSAWVKATSFPNPYNAIVGRETSGAAAYYMMSVKSNGKLAFYITGSGGNTSIDGTGTATLVAGNWYHIVMTYDSVGGLNAYINGVLDKNVAAIGTLASISDTTFIGTHRPASYVRYWSGSLDEVRIYNRALSATEITALYNSGSAKLKAPDNTGLVGYWSFEDGRGTTATDSSGQRNAGTLTNFGLSGSTSNWNTGNACKRGGCLNFDGVNDYVLLPNLDAAVGITNTLTYSAWIRRNAFGIAFDRILLGYTNSWGVGFSATDHLQGTKTGVDGTGQSVFTFNDRNWHHVVMTMDGTNVKFYVDGAFDSSYAYSSSFNSGTSAYAMGTLPNAPDYYLNGTLDEVRVYKRAISATEVTALYNASVTKFASTADLQQGTNLTSGLVGHWTFDGKYMSTTTSTDTSGQGNNGTLTNGPAPVAGRLGQGLSFDGVNDYVDTGNNSASMPSSTGTFAFWYKPVTLTNFQGLVSNGNLSTDRNGVNFYATTSGVVFEVCSAAARLFIQITTGIALNTWNHIAGTWDGTTQRIFLNGVQVNSQSQTVSPTPAYNLTFGRSGEGATYPMNASLDDVRVYNRALSASEVGQLYNLGK